MLSLVEGRDHLLKLAPKGIVLALVFVLFLLVQPTYAVSAQSATQDSPEIQTGQTYTVTVGAYAFLYGDLDATPAYQKKYAAKGSEVGDVWQITTDGKYIYLWVSPDSAWRMTGNQSQILEKVSAITGGDEFTFEELAALTSGRQVSLIGTFFVPGTRNVRSKPEIANNVISSISPKEAGYDLLETQPISRTVDDQTIWARIDTGEVDKSGDPITGWVAVKVAGTEYATIEPIGTGAALSAEDLILSVIKDHLQNKAIEEEPSVIEDKDGNTLFIDPGGKLVAVLKPDETVSFFDNLLSEPPQAVEQVITENILPAWFEGFSAELKVSSGKFVVSDAEGEKYLLDQIIRVLAKQQGITVDALQAQLAASNGKTTLRTLIRDSSNPEELIIFPPALKEGQTVPLDLSQVIIRSSAAPQGFKMELAQDATNGKSIPDWISADVDFADRLVITFFSTSLEAVTTGGITMEEVLESKKVTDMLALYPTLTTHQVRESLLRQKGNYLTLTLLSLLEAYANVDGLPTNGETWSNASPGGDYLIKLLWGDRAHQIDRIPQFPTVDRQGASRKDPNYPNFNPPNWSAITYQPSS